jgi:hypothetical protein
MKLTDSNPVYPIPTKHHNVHTPHEDGKHWEINQTEYWLNCEKEAP